MPKILFPLIFFSLTPLLNAEGFEARVDGSWEIVIVNEGGLNIEKDKWSVAFDTFTLEIISELQAENDAAIKDNKPVKWFGAGVLNDEINRRKTPQFAKQRFEESLEEKRNLEYKAANSPPDLAPVEADLNIVIEKVEKYKSQFRELKIREAQAVTPQ